MSWLAGHDRSWRPRIQNHIRGARKRQPSNRCRISSQAAFATEHWPGATRVHRNGYHASTSTAACRRATSALDPITQSEILNLFARLNVEMETAILYISHDLLSVATLCHRVCILLDGQIVECDTPENIFNSPKHEYTQRLVAALPQTPKRTELGTAVKRTKAQETTEVENRLLQHSFF